MILSPNTGMTYLTKAAILTLALLLALAACSGDDGDEAPSTTSTTTTATSAATTAPQATATPAEAPPIQVVTTTNIAADWVKQVGGDHVDVFSMLPVGADPHGFQPGARDVARIADADLVLSIGLGLEGSWLNELLQNAARDPSSIVELGETIDPIEFAETHIEDVEFLENLMHVVHEVEDGDIGLEEGLEEIKELVKAFEVAEAEHEEEEEGEDHGDEGEEEEGEDHGDEEEDHGDEELSAMVFALIDQVEDGQMEAGAAIEAIEDLTSEGEDEHAGHGHGIHDPHFWFDPLRVKTVVDEIAARLTALDPDRGNVYRANASAYNARLDELHSWTESQVEAVPEDRRLLVTSHDSLGYFANLYGFEVVGVILSITTEVEPSAMSLAELAETAKEYEVPAVFGETTVSERLATSLATESGATLVRLYSGSLGTKGSGAETYIEMARTNVSRITEALK